jgi:hypothetical protein
MQLKKIHTYLVNPGKGEEEIEEISGAEIQSRVGKLFNLLKLIFDSAPAECEHEIIFAPNELGEQQNNCKDLITNYIKNRTLENGKKMALHLQSVTTKRSGQGLLFLLYGESAGAKRIVISRFPSDNGIVAEEGRSLSVEFVEKIFMKNSKAYKSAYYEGSSIDSDFWEGRAVDKQINSDITISEYWIREFLISNFSLTSGRGSARIADAIKTTIHSTNSFDLKDELASAVKLARSLDNKTVSAKTFLRDLNLSNDTISAVLSNIDESFHDNKFKFSANELYKHISYKSLELDNGAYLSAPAEDFDEVYKVTRTGADNTISISTKGKVIDEKLKKAK